MKKKAPKDSKKKTSIGGPYLTMATICERVLQEKDGVQSLMRVFDKLMLTPPQTELPPNAAAGVQFTLVVQLRSGDFIGTKTMRIQALNSPAQDYFREFPLVFGGNENGPLVVLEVILAVGIGASELWWFDISLDGETISRVPLRIEPQPPLGKPETESGKKTAKPKKTAPPLRRKR